MKATDLLANQKCMLKNQAAILAHQRRNQAKLDRILANQKMIAGNQRKLDRILANQKRLLAR